MYKLKQVIEDFIVDEIPDYNLKDSGRFYVFKLSKKGINTMDAINTISKCLKIQKKDISYAGLKDKNAITTQYISILKIRQFKQEYSFNDIILEHKGFLDEKLFPGCLKGNKFKITIRNTDQKPREIKYMVNYFGEQRFSKHNIEIGRLLVKKKFNLAVDLILDTINNPGLSEDYNKNKNNPINILKKLGNSILRIYLHAYQSYLWNICVNEFIKSLANNFETTSKSIYFPLIGFGLDLDDDVKSIISDVMLKEELSLNDFIIRQLPELSLEGDKRAVFVEVLDLSIGEIEQDEFNNSMNKCTISFSLPKGSYATECVKQMME
jgi:tRNA pseudouridine13 synthase